MSIYSESLYDDIEAVTRRSKRQLNQNDSKVPWGTGLVEGAKDLGSRAVNQLQEWAKEDPDTWTDDLLRLTGGGIKNTGAFMSDLERRAAHLTAIAAERGVGVEELEENADTSLLGQISSEDEVALRLESSMNSQMPTDRASRTTQSSNWDTDNPTMRPMRKD